MEDSICRSLPLQSWSGRYQWELVCWSSCQKLTQVLSVNFSVCYFSGHLRPSNHQPFRDWVQNLVRVVSKLYLQLWDDSMYICLVCVIHIWVFRSYAHACAEAFFISLYWIVLGQGLSLNLKPLDLASLDGWPLSSQDPLCLLPEMLELQGTCNHT